MLRGKILQPDHNNSSNNVKVPPNNQDGHNQDDNITDSRKEQAKRTARHCKVGLGSEQDQILHRSAVPRPKVEDIDGMTLGQHSPRHVGAARGLTRSTLAFGSSRSKLLTTLRA